MEESALEAAFIDYASRAFERGKSLRQMITYLHRAYRSSLPLDSLRASFLGKREHAFKTPRQASRSL